MGNWIDILIIIYLLFCFINGTKQKLFFLTINIISFIVSFGLSFFVYSFIASVILIYFDLREVYANIIGFFISILFFRIFTVFILKKIINRKLFAVHKMKIRRFFCGFVSILYGVVVVFLMMSIIHSLYLPIFFKSEFNSSDFGNFIKNDPVHINQDLKKIFSGIIIETTNNLETLTDVGDVEPLFDLGFQVFDFQIEDNLENEMLVLVNKERESRGFKPLVMDEKLRDVARNYGKDMFERGYFGHINPEGKGPADRMNSGGVLFTASGENLVLQSSLAIAHDKLMKSDNHRKNILHFYFHRIGIGIINGGERGIIFVQNFAD